MENTQNFDTQADITQPPIQPNNVTKGITLTPMQETTLHKILDFINHPTDRVFILRGYAGTGKTTLMRFLVKRLEEMETDYRLLASTGRAAKILANLAEKPEVTSTIHSIIYTFNGLNKEVEVEKEERPKVDTTGQLYLIFNKATLRTDHSATVYIIDEASMVSDVECKDVVQAKFGDGRVLRDLLEYDERPNSKFIFVGDPCQLPPIEEYYSPALMSDYFSRVFSINAHEAELTEIMRQSSDNDIITASKQIRELYRNAPDEASAYPANGRRVWGYLPFRQCGNITFHANLGELIDNYVENIRSNGFESATLICRSNTACLKLSNNIRQQLQFNPGSLCKGDLLLVVQNNITTGLLNGDMITVESIAPSVTRLAGLTFRQVQVKELFTQNIYTTLIIEELLYQPSPNLNQAQQQELFLDFIYRMHAKGISQKKNRDTFYWNMEHDPYLNALRCAWGYAITCHKAQGGEWDDVYLNAPRDITLNPIKDKYQWIYTAMTRARSTLHVVNDFFYR